MFGVVVVELVGFDFVCVCVFVWLGFALFWFRRKQQKPDINLALDMRL